MASLSREIQRKIDIADWQQAEALARQQQEIASRLADVESLAQSLGTLAHLENRQGHFPEMAALLAAKERLCRDVGDLAGAIDAFALDGSERVTSRRSKRSNPLGGTGPAIGQADTGSAIERQKHGN